MTITALRPTWDQHWMSSAHLIAKRSLCTRSQVGAVVVNTTNDQVTEGYNNPPPKFDHRNQPCAVWCARAQKNQDTETLCPGYTDCPSVHAEANALGHASKEVMKGGTLYVTSHVCFTCAKSIATFHLRRVVVDPDGRASHRVPHTGYTFLNNLGIKVDIW